MFQYAASVIRIVDGDTLWLNIDLGFRVHLEIDVRLARINAPEAVNWSAKGLDDPAKGYIQRNCPPGSMCVVQISKPDKYARWIADVFFQPGVIDRDKILANPRVLSDELVREGLAQSHKY